MIKIEPTRFTSLNKRSHIKLHCFIHQFEYDTIRMPKIPHSFLLVYLKKGYVRVQIGERIMLAQSGDVVVLRDSLSQKVSFSAYKNQAALDYYVLHMTDLECVRERDSPIITPTPPPEIISAKFSLLEAELMSSKDGWEDICSSELDVLAQLLARDLRPMPIEDKTLSRAEELLNDIVDYIHVHYSEKITLQSVADVFYISPYYLSHLFDSKKGISFVRYITHLRIHEAKILLRTTDYSIRQIAQMIGYKSVNYFFNVFKAKTGMSPNLFRTKPT